MKQRAHKAKPKAAPQRAAVTPRVQPMPPVQAKMALGPVGDRYEQEADRIAAQVTSGPRRSQPSEAAGDTGLQRKPLGETVTPLIQRQAAAEHEEAEQILQRQAREPESEAQDLPETERLQRQPEETLERGEETIQAKNGGLAQRAAPRGVEEAVRSSRGGGGPLPAPVRTKMEQGFGNNFGQVRVHTGPDAADLNRELRSRAFTVGRDIYFGQSQFDPHSSAGQRLIAHELTHTIQQGHGGDRIQRAPDGPNKPQAQQQPADPLVQEIEELTAKVHAGKANDDDRLKLRLLLLKHAKRTLGRYKADVDKKPDLNALSGTNKSRYQRITAAADAAIKSIKRSRDRENREARLADLEAIRRLLNGKYFAYLLFDFPAGQFDGLIAIMRNIGNPAAKFSKKDLEGIRYETSIWQMGQDSAIVWMVRSQTMEVLKLKEKDLKLKGDHDKEGGAGLGEPGKEGKEKGGGGDAEKDKAKQAKDAEAKGKSGGQGKQQATKDAGDTESTTQTEAGQPLSDKDKKLLRDFLDQLQAEKAPADQGAQTDPELLALLKGMKPEERADFIKFYESTLAAKADDPNATDLKLTEALKMYRKLSPAQREILRTNRELAQGPAAAKLPEHISLDIKSDAKQTEKLHKDAKKLNESLARINQMVDDPNIKQQLSPLDPSSLPFFDEMMMFKGLLAGASSQSPEIKEISRNLMKQMHDALIRIQHELEWLAAQMLAEQVVLSLITAATAGGASEIQGARAVMVLKKLNDLRLLLKKIQKIYSIIQKVRSVIANVKAAIELITTAKERFAEFRERYDDYVTRIEHITELLQDIDAAPNLEEEREQLQEKLMEELQKQLDGGLGEILETFYIPDDATPEELETILLNIPRGIDAFKDMLKYYDSANHSDKEFTEILAVKAVRAGALLYPFVGFLAAIAGDKLQQLFPDKPLDQRAMQFLERLTKLGGGIGKKPGRKSTFRQKVRALFDKLRPKHYEYDKLELQAMVDKGAAWIEMELKKDKGGEKHWAPKWFRYQMRGKLKALRTHARANNWTVKARPKKDKTAPWKQVPVPHFKLDWPSRFFNLFRKQKQLSVELELNPKHKITVDALDYKDFAGSGIPYKNRGAKEQRAIRERLKDLYDYEFIKDNKGNDHIRLAGGTTKPGYLRIVGNNIRHGIERDPYPQFRGRLVNDSSDLPEGYYMRSDGVVELKSGARRLGLPRLGLDESGQLVKGEGVRERKEVAKPELTQPGSGDLENYDWPGALDAMYNKDGTDAWGYDNQGYKRDFWEGLATRTPIVKQRPTQAKGRLGYVVNARLGGDLLGGRHLPDTKKGDDKGHLIAKRFGGTDNYQNLIPMKGSVNRWPGAWYKAEKAMAGVYVGKRKKPAGSRVAIELNVRYPSRATRRPSSLKLVWKVVGKKPSGSTTASVAN